MIRKSRLVAALALALALGVGGLAFASGATEHEAGVTGKVKPKKLDKKKFKKVKFNTGVVTTGGVTGTQSNPASEYISFGKNIKFKLSAAPVCTATLTNGSTPEQARAACPAKSYLGGGHAEVQGPGGTVVDELVVSAFNGPGANQLRLHTYGPVLGAASPTVQGDIVKSNAGRKYGKALKVVSPVTGALMITQFDTNIDKSTGVVRARCKAKKFLWQRVVTYDDSSTDTAKLSQKCKRKR